MIEIVQPEQTQEADIRRIWREGFHDSEDYLDFFFARRYRAQDTLLARYDGKSAGISMLLPATLKKPGREKRALLLFVVTTLPQWRGRGVFHRLMDEVRDRVQKQDIALFGIPRPGLCPVYEKWGLREAFNAKEYSFPARAVFEPSVWSFEKLKAEDRYAVREAFFRQSSFVSWDAQACAFALEEERFCGGFALLGRRADGRYAIIGRVDRNCLMVKETTLPDEELEAALSTLAMQKGCERVTVKLPEFSAYGKTVFAGMGARMQEFSPSWLSFALN